MVTISAVESTKPERLTETAQQLGTKVAAINTTVAAAQQVLATLRTTWQGPAADAAIAAAESHITRQQEMATRLTAMQNALSSAGTNLTALRDEILAMKDQVAKLGGTVDDDGTVKPRVLPFGSFQMLTPTVCDGYTKCFKALLTQFDNIDQLTAAAIQTAQTAPLSRVPQGRQWTEDDLYGDGGPKLSDVNQNALGDCYLAATMGSIAQANPQWIRDRITYNPQTGEFDVTLWDGQQWRHIPVTQADIDANIAARGGSGVDTGDPTRPNDTAPLWPAVLESAYGKMNAPGKAPYTGIGQGGYTKDAMEALTGNRGMTVDPQQEWFRTLNVDQQIGTALAGNQPVVLSTTGDVGNTGLEPRHVYTVTGISGTGGDAVVTLQNPWQPSAGDSGLETVKLGDLMGSGLSGALGNGPVQNFNVGRLGQ